MSHRRAAFTAWLAVGFAIFLALAEIVRNWGDMGYAPFWVVDYIAVGLLLHGAWRALQKAEGNRRPSLAPLCGGWGFTCAMFYASFFSHLQHLDQADHGPIEHTRLTVTIGVLFAITIVGFGLSLFPPRD